MVRRYRHMLPNHEQAAMHAIEQNRTLAEVLAAKGIEAEFGDFLEHRGQYDRVLMNPPFENSAEIAHVRHAYSLLRPGGRLVSVMSVGPFSRSDRASLEFREWLDGLTADVEQLPEDSFKGVDAFRETSVRTALVTMDKEDHET